MAKRDSNNEKMDDVFKKLIRSYGMTSRFNEFEVVQVFSEIMGPVIMKKVSNAYVYQHKLFLELTSAPLKQELSMEKTKLINMINKELGQDYLKGIIIK